jgi:hypothetical protein
MTHIQTFLSTFNLRCYIEESDVYKIVQQAAVDDALIIYTLSEASMSTAVKTACKLYEVGRCRLTLSSPR